MPETSANEVMLWPMEKHLNQFTQGQARTLQRRIAQWSQDLESQEEKLRALMINETSPQPIYSMTGSNI